MSETSLWPLIHAERGALADALQGLSDEQWATTTLCDAWTVEDVAAHVTAAAQTKTAAWLANFAISRFDTDRHNQRLLEKHRGANAGETLARLRASVSSRIVPLNSAEGGLGEIVVHSQDIARPLGLDLEPSPRAVDAVATFFAARDFAVNSRSLVKGLRLEATDGDFRAGDGPGVAGPTLALVMAMAGRRVYLDELSGEGVGEFRERVAA